MKNTTNNKNYFTLDFFAKTISGTKASFNKANKGFGDAYEELTSKMSAHPTFELVVKEQKIKSKQAKRTYSGLDFKFMEDYIKTLDNADIVYGEYKEVRKVAVNAEIKEFPFTKKWFLEKFGSEENGFNMDDAKERISMHLMSQAKKNADTNPPVLKSAS
ncbi:MAG: hypothetical protein IJA31_12585 [Clostridia bacterium]|nr:hypothetical protein [Clostridia bacterium]